MSMEDEKISIEKRIEEIRGEMGQFTDVLTRYSFLVELSAYMIDPDPYLLTEEWLYPNCQSKVWIRYSFGDEGLEIEAFSDTLIIRGILYVLTELYRGCTAEEIAETDVDVLTLCGVEEQFNSTRSGNIKRLQNDLREYACKCLSQVIK